MWRGQTREHYLERPDDEKLRLFGEKSIREPSLIPSAARVGLEFPNVFVSWAAVLDVYLAERGLALSQGQSLNRELANFRASYNYRLWAFSTAQHYGLPSVGLDVTSDFWTAVMFALHEFRFDPTTSATRVTRVGQSAQPVLYAMAGFENDLVEDELIAPAWLQCARPKAQAAHFFATGWGAAANKAAERIFVAIRLVDHVKWRLPKRVEHLFPSSEDDPLLAFLLRIRKEFPEIADETQLGRVYHVL